jgi:hypothetical protein
MSDAENTRGPSRENREDAAARERRGHAEDVREQAEHQVADEAADREAAALAQGAAGATAAREIAESEQLAAAKERARRREGEREAEAAEQARVDDAREAEKKAHEAADRAVRHPGDRDLFLPETGASGFRCLHDRLLEYACLHDSPAAGNGIPPRD